MQQPYQPKRRLKWELLNDPTFSTNVINPYSIVMISCDWSPYEMPEEKDEPCQETVLVYANVRRWGQNVLLALCDADLLGTVLRDGRIVFEVREDFYKGLKISVEEAIDLIGQSTIINMVGKNIVRKALEKGLVHPQAILKISGVPHAQIVKI